MPQRAEKKELVKEKLRSFVPDGFEVLVADLIFTNPVRFKIVKPRTTKLGDFRAPFQGEKAQITVNGNLNRYAFLITTLHEFAHLHTYIKFGSKVKPHGDEWKNEYRALIYPIIDKHRIPESLCTVLLNSLIKTKASSCSDLDLTRELKKYDPDQEHVVFLEKLPKNSRFELQGKIFLKGELRRKRYLCEEIITKRKYLVHALSEVTPNEETR